MLAATDAVATLSGHWLAAFDKALAAKDRAALRELFHPDCHWRDALALTWRIATVSGRDAVVDRLQSQSASRFELDPARTPPRYVSRAGEKCIEAIFRFETPVGRGSGVLRL